MIERNSVVISDNKKKEFIEFMNKFKKGKDYWEKNKDYLKSHRIDMDELEALYKS